MHSSFVPKGVFVSKYKICLVDDEVSILDVLENFFTQQAGFEVVKYFDANNFKRDYKDLNDINAYIIDVRMDGELVGFDLVSMIRKDNSIVPIFMLTACDSKDDIIKGIEAGADDYITKPCHLSELLARLNNAIKKVESINNSDKNLKMLTEGKLVMYKGNSVSLTSREFAIFRELYLNEGQPVEREVLLSSLDPESEMIKRNVDVHVFSLRKKLQTINVEVRTIRGIGYCLEVEA